MSVDDHAIDALRVWFDLAYENLKNEYKTMEYAKLSDCPSYNETAAYRTALNVLLKGCYLPEYYEKYKIPKLRLSILEEFETERFQEFVKTCPHEKTEVVIGHGRRVTYCEACYTTLENVTMERGT